MGAKWFGAAVKRKEDPALLAGKGRFVDDVRLPGALHAAFVRSPHAHARIRGIDTSAAKAVKGVHLVLGFSDLPEPLQKNALPLFVPAPAITQLHLPYALAREETVYVGEPVAIVAADSRHIAEDAAALVEVDYEPLAAVSDCAAAMMPGGALAHTENSSNIAARVPITVGNADAAFAGAAHVVRERLFIHRGGPFFMECRGVLASHDAVADSYTVYVSSQGSHRIKRGLLDVLDLNDNQMHVITPDVGGGFGPKGAVYPEYPCVAACAKMLGRPVKWIEDRRENFLCTHQERDQVWDLELAADRDGRILGLRGRLVHDTGAYIPWGLVLPWIAATTVPGPYVIPHFKIELNAVYTNMISTTPVRGAGRPQGVFVMERMMDRLAEAVGLDRAEVRRRNFIAPTQMPYKVGIVSRDGRPVTYDSGDYPASQARALAAADYAGFPARQAEALREGRYIGIGISNAVESTGLGPYEGATVRVATTGKVVLYTGATPQGQSHKTTLAQIAADQLGVSYEDVTVATADTKDIAFGVGTFAARTAVNAGSSAHLAAAEVARKIKLIAADMLEVSPDDLELRGGFAEVRGVPGLKKSFREIAVKSIGMPGFSMAGGLSPGLENTAYFQPDQSTYSNGTHVAEVEVDIETGGVKILRYTVLHDCGAVINPMVVEGQVVGGVAHGIGNALFERLHHDGDAQPQTTNFGEYLLPAAPDMPPIAILHSETASPLNPLGVKGAGEGGTIAAIGAIIGAVENALAPFGIKINEAPVSPARIVELLNAVRGLGDARQ
ncbi:MAG TPA: xanthine dehydrogenase family protein molybdopterin-binding subunit [Xanthobacteraceae bacterium]|jgi:carbon-monoxide dehydrogenase large subunit|nr:xanthine dehydrogenase family protein molybdopterin-binding subunit [Xanthobacteraceae bacterium]